jgi:ppGpp synthetase/RelA/SpoT-type nucleotidyltranferase
MISKSQIDKIGKDLINNQQNDETLEKLSDWRGLHIYALNQAFKIIKKKADKIGNNAIYGQRLKRLNSIIIKLKRFNTRLSSMQDIGGCRVVLSDFKKVMRLFWELQSTNSIKELKNYIFSPKDDGYRSIHLVYTLKSKKPEYNGLHIEIQLRTVIQHAWATTLEIVDLFEKQQLKLGKGDEDWKRFFYLVAEEFALFEGLPLHNSNNSKNERLLEINNLIEKLDVNAKLKGYINIIDGFTTIKTIDNFVVISIINENEFGFLSFKDFNKAKDYYLKVEKQYIGDNSQNIILVEAKSLKKLKKAYPNYFIDTTLFLDTLNKIISKK